MFWFNGLDFFNGGRGEGLVIKGGMVWEESLIIIGHTGFDITCEIVTKR